jgi:hypothetical protein
MLPHFWMLIPSFTYGTPRPFNITTGLDNNQDGHFTDRPSFADPNDPRAISTPFGLLNPNPKPGETIIPRNFGRGSRQLSADLVVAKIFVLQSAAQGHRSLAANFSVKNLLNTANLGDYSGVLLAPRFGQANTAKVGRQISFGLGFSF